jgi:transposase
MPNTDFTTIFLEIENTIIEKVENKANKIIVLLYLKRRPHKCPQCKAITDPVHDYRLQTVKDLPVLGKPLLWKFYKRRYACPCYHKRFQERNGVLPKFHRITKLPIDWPFIP